MKKLYIIFVKHLTINPYMVNFNFSTIVNTNGCIYDFRINLTEESVPRLHSSPESPFLGFYYHFSNLEKSKIWNSNTQNVPFHTFKEMTSIPN